MSLPSCVQGKSTGLQKPHLTACGSTADGEPNPGLFAPPVPRGGRFPRSRKQKAHIPGPESFSQGGTSDFVPSADARDPAQNVRVSARGGRWAEDWPSGCVAWGPGHVAGMCHF